MSNANNWGDTLLYALSGEDFPAPLQETDHNIS